MRRTILSVAFAAVALVPCGCGGRKASTPEQAVANLRRALAKKDRSAFMDCFEESRKFMPALRAFFDSVENTAPCEKDMSPEGKVLGQLQPEWLDGPQCTLLVRDVEATCKCAGGMELDLVRLEKGGWVVRPEEFLVRMSARMGRHLSAIASPDEPG